MCVSVLKKLKLLLLIPLFLSMSACIGTVIGAVVDTTIEVVKIPFKVVGAAVDVVTGDDLTDLSETGSSGSVAPIDSEQAALEMENSEFR